MSSDNQALREQIAQAIAGHHIDVHKSGMVNTAEINTNDAQRLADAVLPVVQAHEKALRAELDQLKTLRHGDPAMFVAALGYDLGQRELASLRDAVAQLADEYQARADDDPWDETSVEIVAERLRSLLPQDNKEQQ